MGVLNYGVILLYLVGMIAIGVYASKKVHGSSDFAIGGRSIGPFVITCSSIATAAGASACMGQAGSAYLNGFSSLWLGIAWAIGMLILGLMGKRIYATGAESIPEVFHKLHGNTAGKMCAIFAIIYSLSTLTAQMMGMGTVLQLMLGENVITYEAAVIVGGVITIIYTLQGGFFAVAYTDTAQAIILGVSMMIILPIVVMSGMANVALETVETVFTPGSFNIFYGVSFVSLAVVICKYTFSACTGIPYIQRVLASRNEKEARNSQIYAAIGYMIFSCVVMILAVFARSMFPTMEREETIILEVIVQKFPVVLAGLAIAGLIAAVMSSIDSYLLVVSQIFTTELCGFFVKDMDEKKTFRIERISTVVTGVVTMLIAIQLTSILSMFEVGATIYSSAMFFPFVLALYWKKVTTPGVVSGMVAGGVAAIVLQFVPNPIIDPVIFGNICSLIGTVAVSLCYKQKESNSNDYYSNL
ncbi:MAG: sodium:solute symporter family protein [Eubacteriales bacterium]